MKTLLSSGLAIASLLLISCGSSDDDNNLSYDIQVIDGLSNEKLANTSISMYYNIGGTYVMDSAEGITDADGRVTIELYVDQDSVATILAEDPFLTEVHLNQPISVNSDAHLLYELQQDSAIHHIRPRLDETKPIVTKVYRHNIFTMKMIDQEPKVTERVIFEYNVLQDHPRMTFPVYGSSLNVFEPNGADTMLQLLYVGDQVNYTIEYSLSTIDSLTEQLDTFAQSSTQFVGQLDLPDQVVEITF